MRTKTDKSSSIHQRDKVKKELLIKELNWTEKQKQIIDIALNNQTKVVFISAPAGAAKTILAVYSCLRLLSDKKISDILYVRSAVEVGKKIGFLPGDSNDKLAPYNVPFYDKLSELLNKGDVEYLKKDNRVSCLPINYARGLSLNVKGIIFDECQNSTAEEIFTIMTRMGPYCKLFLLADVDQSDLPERDQGDFNQIFNLFSDEEANNKGIATISLTEDDIMRSELVKFVVSRKKLFTK